MVTLSYLHRISCRSKQTLRLRTMDSLIAHFVPDKGWVGQSVHSGYTATSGYKLHGSRMLYGLYSTKPEGGGLYKAIWHMLRVLHILWVGACVLLSINSQHVLSMCALHFKTNELQWCICMSPGQC